MTCRVVYLYRIVREFSVFPIWWCTTTSTRVWQKIYVIGRWRGRKDGWNIYSTGGYFLRCIMPLAVLRRVSWRTFMHDMPLQVYIYFEVYTGIKPICQYINYIYIYIFPPWVFCLLLFCNKTKKKQHASPLISCISHRHIRYHMYLYACMCVIYMYTNSAWFVCVNCSQFISRMLSETWFFLLFPP